MSWAWRSSSSSTSSRVVTASTAGASRASSSTDRSPSTDRLETSLADQSSDPNATPAPSPDPGMTGDAGAILDPATAVFRDQAALDDAAEAERAQPGPPTGFRTPFREEPGLLILIDQRKLPHELVEVEIRNAPEAANAIRQMIVRGAPAIGQVAALGMALTAERAADTLPFARRAILRGAAGALRGARPTAVNLGWAVDRMMGRFEAIGDLSDDGVMVATALRDEANAIVAEATEDHGRLAEFGLAALPVKDFGPLRILTHCNTGPLACGQFGTALGIVQAAHHAERDIAVWVDETRPYLQGARLTAWELEQAGVPHTLIA